MVKPQSIAVILPHQEMFSEITRGIEGHLNYRIKSYTLEDGGLECLGAWLDQHAIEVVIALGWPPIHAMLQLEGEWPVVAGAVTLDAAWIGKVEGISLQIDPAIALARLKKLVPASERVHMVYAQGNYPCSMGYTQMRKLASQLGLTLLSYAIDSAHLSARVRAYQAIVGKGLNQHDVIWLCGDIFGAQENVIFPHLLEVAWRDRLVLISDKPAHVKKGALFAFTVDYTRMGERLAEIAVRRLREPTGKSVISAQQDICLLINLRTAVHLGIPIARRTQGSHLTLLPDGLVVDWAPYPLARLGQVE